MYNFTVIVHKILKIGKYIYGVKLSLTQHFRNKLIFIKA